MENKKQENSQKAPKSLWRSFGRYIKFIFFDFFTSFKYNKMKLPGFLVAIPGIFLGFFLTFHIPVVNNFSFKADSYVNGSLVTTEYFPDISALVLFVLVLFGILNLFTAFNMMSKKNLGSVITATITTVIIVAAGAIYLVMLFLYVSLCQQGIVVLPDGATFTWSTNYLMSMLSVIISMVCSVAGVILGFIFYDRNYKKVNF